MHSSLVTLLESFYFILFQSKAEPHDGVAISVPPLQSTPSSLLSRFDAGDEDHLMTDEEITKAELVVGDANATIAEDPIEGSSNKKKLLIHENVSLSAAAATALVPIRDELTLRQRI